MRVQHSGEVGLQVGACVVHPLQNMLRLGVRGAHRGGAHSDVPEGGVGTQGHLSLILCLRAENAGKS